MAKGVVTVSSKHGYVVRNGASLRFQEIGGPWDAPALGTVEIPMESEIWAAILVLAALAYPPRLIDRERPARLKAAQAMGAWWWRSLNESGRVRKKDMPPWAKEIRADRLEPQLEHLKRRICDRLDGAEFVFWLALGAGGFAKLGARKPSVKELARRYSATKLTDDQTDNVRHRIWQLAKPVVHVADALRLLISDTQRDIWDLLGNPDWVQRLLEDAEGRRLTVLPSFEYPIHPEETLKFKPV